MRFRKRIRQPVLTPARGYDLWAASYHNEDNPVQRIGRQLLYELLADQTNRRTLDIGCGTGRSMEVARNRGASIVIGLDFSIKMLHESIRNIPECVTALAHSERLPFETGCFDTVVCALHLSHLSSLEKAVREMARVLRPGGQVIITEFHPLLSSAGARRTFTDQDGNSHEIKHYLYQKTDYVRALVDAGFVDVNEKDGFHESVAIVAGFSASKRLTI